MMMMEQIGMMQTKYTTKSYANNNEESMNDANNHLPTDNIFLIDLKELSKSTKKLIEMT